MNIGIDPDSQNPVFEDGYIAVTLHDFRPDTGKATVIVRDERPVVGFYYIWVRFVSGNGTRVDFDGNNPAQLRVLDIQTFERPDRVREIEVKRIRD